MSLVAKGDDAGRAITAGGGRYRYFLDRRLALDGPPVGWVMLNPSVATHDVDDHTVRVISRLSRSWGYGRLVVVNLFGLVATDPSELRRVPQTVAVGAENDAYLYTAMSHVERIVVAWGAGGVLHNRGLVVGQHLLDRYSGRVVCLGVTRGGHPRHPARGIPTDVELVEWPGLP